MIRWKRWSHGGQPRTERRSIPIPYADALPVAQELEALLAPSSERILIAGSIRRQQPQVSGIDLVVVPIATDVRDMFGQVVGQQSLLDLRLADMGIRTFDEDDTHFKQFFWHGIRVDLFIQADPATWGVAATLHTGSVNYSTWLVTSRRKGGALPAGWRVADGRLWNAAQVVDTPEEQDVFAALGLDWVPPTERTAEATAVLWWR